MKIIIPTYIHFKTAAEMKIGCCFYLKHILQELTANESS